MCLAGGDAACLAPAATGTDRFVCAVGRQLPRRIERRLPARYAGSPSGAAASAPLGDAGCKVRETILGGIKVSKAFRAVCAAIGLSIFALAGCASIASTGADTTAPASSPAPVTVTRTEHPKAVKPKSSPKRSRTRRKRHQRHAEDSGNWVMPNEVGRGLQAAQDDLQRVSGDPVFFSHSHDLAGDRFQILDSDWKVCTQNVAPGTRVGPAAHVDFGVVKLDESCP